MNPVGIVQSATDFDGVVSGIMAASPVGELASAYIDAVKDFRRPVASEDDLRAAAMAFAKTVRRIPSGIDAEQFNYEIGRMGALNLAFEVAQNGLVGQVGSVIQRSARTLFAGKFQDIPGQVASLQAQHQAAKDFIAGLGLPSDAEAVAYREMEKHYGGMLRQARVNDGSRIVTEAAKSVRPEGGPQEMQKVLNALKQITDGMSPADVTNFMRFRGGSDALENAGKAIGDALVAGVGPGSMPKPIAELVAKARPQEVVVGKIRAAGADEFKRLYAEKFNSAMATVLPSIQAEYNQTVRDMSQKLMSKYPSLGKEVESYQAYEEEKKSEQQKIYDSVVLKQRAMANEIVARDAGVDPQELQRRMQEIEEMAGDLAQERARVGADILAEVRKIGVPREDAMRLQAEKVSVDKSAIVLMGRDPSKDITELFEVIGGAVTDAGRVEVMGIAALKKKYPGLSSSKGVKRAFCTQSTNATSSGGQDFNAIGMGTESSGRTTLWHEMGHWIEHNNPLVRGMIKAWFERRTKGEKPVSLKKLFPNAGYSAKEVVLRDKFLHPYMGKIYSSGSTEILSMGMEYLSSPEGSGELAAKDPDMMAFILKIIEVVNGRN